MARVVVSRLHDTYGLHEDPMACLRALGVLILAGNAFKGHRVALLRAIRPLWPIVACA